MISKLSTVIFIVMGGMLLLSGCNNQSIIGDREKNIENSHEGMKKVILWHTYSEEETKVFENSVIPLFEEEHPTIDIVPVRQAYSDQLKSAIISRASTNNPPDIVRMDIAWLPLFEELGLLYPVSELEDFKKISDTLYYEPLQSNLYEGKYYGLPLNTNTKIAIYNQSLLAKAGLENPPETIEEIFSIAEKNGYQIGLTGFTAWELLPYFYGFGGKLMDDSYSHSRGYLDSEESIRAINRLVEYYRKDILSEKILTQTINSWQGIQSGDYFMMDDGPWFYSVQTQEQLRKINELTVYAPFPVTNGYGSILGGESLVITKGSKEVEAAWTFIKWMMGVEPQSLMLQTGLIPTNKKIEYSELFDQHPYYKVYSESINNSFLRPTVSEWNQIDQIFTQYITSIFIGGISVEEGLAEAAKEIEQLLK